jgi:hypothetical protein
MALYRCRAVFTCEVEQIFTFAAEDGMGDAVEVAGRNARTRLQGSPAGMEWTMSKLDVTRLDRVTGQEQELP